MSLYLVVGSNECKTQFPKNNAGSFDNVLYKQIQLSSSKNWSVGLASISTYQITAVHNLIFLRKGTAVTSSKDIVKTVPPTISPTPAPPEILKKVPTQRNTKDMSSSKIGVLGQ